MLNNLTSLRFFLALVVVTSHLAFFQYAYDLKLDTYLRYWILSGGVAVQFFFMLSGFILTHTYFDKLMQKKVSVGRYLYLRIIRLYPANIITLAMILMAHYLIHPERLLESGELTIDTILRHFSLLQAYTPENIAMEMVNSPAWSLGDEMFFYLMLPLLFLIFSDNIRKYIVLVILYLFLLCLLPVFLNQETVVSWYTFFPPIRLIEFVTGILIYFIYKNTKKIFSEHLFSIAEVSSIVLILIVFILRYILPLPKWSGYLYFLPFTAIILLVFSYNKGIISKSISNKKMIFLGEASFSIYMCHWLCLTLLYEFGTFLNPAEGIWYEILYLISGVLLTVGAGCLFHTFIDKPIHDFLKRRKYFSGKNS